MSGSDPSIERRMTVLENDVAAAQAAARDAEKRTRMVEQRMIDFDERQTGQVTRILALSTAVEYHLALFCLERGPLMENAITQALRNAKPNDMQFQTDLAAAWWSDVVVQIPQHMDALIVRLEQVLQGLLGAQSSHPQ